MKKIIISLIVLIGSVTINNISAQNGTPGGSIELGIHLMPMFTSLELKQSSGETVQATTAVGIGYGGLVSVNLSDNIGIQGEVNYNAISQRYTDRNLERTVDIKYLDIPVLLSLNTGKSRPVNFNLVLGPQFGLNVGADVTSTETTSEVDTLSATVAVRDSDIGAAYGAGFEFGLGTNNNFKIALGFRGTYGFVDITSQPTGPDTYNVLVKGARKSYGAYGGIRLVF